ncbi:3'-5' exonuclease [Microcoleus sp. herbarium14]|uniref:3'-5' exonuclease n=1 Tax=Microcoleus sp. herbarium14 TaxID=3055439 RepID=UPI002FD266C6
MNLKHYNYYLVVDLEATCCDRGNLIKEEMEIIEIGAVMVEAENLNTVDEFQSFIKPVRYPILTEFCKSLTSIAQAQVDVAPSYSEAIALLKKWLSGYSNGVFGSWGDFDRQQFQQDSNFHKVPFPIAYPHINLKQLFTEKQGLRKRHGMAQALQLAGLPLEGTHHRGIDDARNIAKLLPYLLEQKHLS